METTLYGRLTLIPVETSFLKKKKGFLDTETDMHTYISVAGVYSTTCPWTRMNDILHLYPMVHNTGILQHCLISSIINLT